MTTSSRISVTLDEHEFGALMQMARADCREPREQLRFLLRAEALQRGLLRDAPTDQTRMSIAQEATPETSAVELG